MKQKVFIFIFLILLLAVLVGLNAASYTQKEKTPDSESSPNRSTFNAGATGTQAFYSLLVESGRKATRWQEPPAALLTAKDAPAVFVVIGTTRREFTAIEAEDLLRWVSSGGQLVVIDREPPEALAATTTSWKLVFDGGNSPDIFTVDTADQNQMTADTAAVKAVQPTVFTHSVNAVQPSRFATSIGFTRFAAEDHGAQKEPDENEPPRKRASGSGAYVESPRQIAPVIQFAGSGRNLVVETAFGQGRILFLSDPYVVSNGGIALIDNAQLAINLVSAEGRTVAFDEYHQGYGTDSNRFLQFFEGTPVVAIFFQSAILIGLLLFSQSRRFARPVPEPEPDRLSKLEYVEAMAGLQNRAKAYDLAIENIYNDFRRRAARYFSLDYFSAKSGDIARLIAEHTGQDRVRIEDFMFKCEEIIRGEPTNKREIVRLVNEIREIEEKLGMNRLRKPTI